MKDLATFLFAALALLACTLGQSTAGDVKSNWTVEQLPTDCVVVFSDIAANTMFSYQLQSNGEHVIGYRPPDWGPQDGREIEAGEPLMIRFGDEAIAAAGRIDPLIGKEVGRGKPLTPKDFKLFQNHKSFEVVRKPYRLNVPLIGVDRIRAEFAACLKNLASAGTQPQIRNWDLGEEVFDAVQAAILDPGSNELAIRVDARGKAISCRSDPDGSKDEKMQKACRLYMDAAEFTPATDADGNAIEGEFIVFDLK